jgi:hypothetical protein
MSEASELNKLRAENLEWLRIVRGYLDCDEDSPEEAEWVWQMWEMRRGRSAIHTPQPIVDQLLAERDRHHRTLDRLHRQLGELYYSPALTMREGNSDLRLIVGMMLREPEPLTAGGDVGTK